MAVSDAVLRQHEKAIDTFNALANAKMQEGLNRPQAVAWIAANAPAVHQAFISAGHVLREHGLSKTPDVGGFGGDAKAIIETRIADRMRTYGVARHEAFKQVMRENPDLRHALVINHNLQHGRKRGAQAYRDGHVED